MNLDHHFNITPLDASFGARVTDLDLTNLSDAEVTRTLFSLA